MQKFVIPYKLPSLNDYINACRTKSYMAAAMKKRVERDIMSCMGGLKPVEKQCVVEMHFWEPDRRRDVDNVESAKKFCLDSLVKAGILKGDSPRWVRAVPSYTHYGGNRVEVILRDVTDQKEAPPMNLDEILSQFKEMTAKAKILIKNGEEAGGFAFGVAEFTAQMGGKHPQHMAEIVAEGKRRISEIARFGAECGRR